VYVITYSGDGSTPPENLHLPSEHAAEHVAVVVDTGQ
jgi:hypothetical protein